MEGTLPAAIREFFLLGAGKFLRCHKACAIFSPLPAETLFQQETEQQKVLVAGKTAGH
jgi:hypothetical protein